VRPSYSRRYKPRRLQFEDHQADEIFKCAGNVGRRDDESVAGALNDPLFESVGDVLGAAHHCPRALARRAMLRKSRTICTAMVDLPLNGAGCRSRLRQLDLGEHG
jgi:hypothetical protein